MIYIWAFQLFRKSADHELVTLNWRVTPENLRSAGKCTPYEGYELQGRARYTLDGGDIRYEAV